MSRGPSPPRSRPQSAGEWYPLYRPVCLSACKDCMRLCAHVCPPTPTHTSSAHTGASLFKGFRRPQSAGGCSMVCFACTVRSEGAIALVVNTPGHCWPPSADAASFPTSWCVHAHAAPCCPAGQFSPVLSTGYPSYQASAPSTRPGSRPVSAHAAPYQASAPSTRPSSRPGSAHMPSPPLEGAATPPPPTPPTPPRAESSSGGGLQATHELSGAALFYFMVPAFSSCNVMAAMSQMGVAQPTMGCVH